MLFSGWRFSRARILSFSQEYPKDGQTVRVNDDARPTSIEIPSVGIKLEVVESEIKDGIWEISYTGASHLNKSAYPGEGGNIIFYGHNRRSLFGPIRWLEKDAEIILTGKNSEKHSYKVVETVEVSPENIQYVLPKSEETLTLYTCTGLFDSKRFIVVAKPL